MAGNDLNKCLDIKLIASIKKTDVECSGFRSFLVPKAYLKYIILALFTYFRENVGGNVPNLSKYLMNETTNFELPAMYLYQMITQNPLRTCEGKLVLF